MDTKFNSLLLEHAREILEIVQIDPLLLGDVRGSLPHHLHVRTAQFVEFALFLALEQLPLGCRAIVRLIWLTW